MIGQTALLGSSLLAACPACTANNVPYGWFILSGTVLVIAMAGAGFLAWKDTQ